MKLKWLGSLQDLTGNHVVALFVNDAISTKAAETYLTNDGVKIMCTSEIQTRFSIHNRG